MKEKDYITAYKVVSRGTRKGTNLTLFNGIYVFNRDNKIQWIQEHPEYFPRYTRLNIIKEAPNSAGLMCFEAKDQAQSFIRSISGQGNFDFVILRVMIRKSDIKPNVPIVISCVSSIWNLENWKYHKNSSWFGHLNNPPVGTIFCKKLKVLS